MVGAMQGLLTQRREPGQWLDWGNFLLWRRTFETYTGVDCSRFYDSKGSFMPLNAAAALEKYVAREPRVEFEPGQRYFFGHRVPYLKVGRAIGAHASAPVRRIGLLISG
jgi:hypothetical protein